MEKLLFHVLLLVGIAFASAAISFTITTTSIFKWLRELVSPVHHKFEELIHCPWCLSHYITLFWMLIYLRHLSFMLFILTWFAIQGIIGLLHYVYLRTYEPVAKAMAQRLIEKLRKNA